MNQKKKIVLILQARLGSKRLPNKAILPLVNKISIIEFLIKRLILVKQVDKFYLATSKKKINDSLITIAKKNKIEFYRGSENNVIERFIEIGKKENANIIVRVCGDNPLTDPYLIDKLIEYYLNKKKINHLSTFAQPSLPYGIGCAIFDFESLKYIYKKFHLNKFSNEHVEPKMLESKKVKTLYYKADSKEKLPNLNLSIDNYWNYEYVKGLTNYLFKKYKFNFTTSNIISLYKKPKVGIFANGLLGKLAVNFLIKQKIDIEFLVHHPLSEASYLEDIKHLTGLDKKRFFSYDDVEKNPNILNKFNPLIGFSFWSSYIIPKKVLDYFPLGVFNLHNSLLPSLRGSGANIWTLIKDVDAGVSLHKIDLNIDKGNIIDTQKIKVDLHDDGKSVFIKQHSAMMLLLKRNFERIIYGTHQYIKSPYKDSFFSKSKRDNFKKIYYNQKYSAKEFINIIRAYQFGKLDSAVYVDENKKNWKINIKLKKI